MDIIKQKTKDYDMHQDIEEKLNAITDSLRQDLLHTGAINDKDKIIKPQTFIDIIEHKESEINKLFSLVEKDGVIVDRNGNELIYARLEILSDMKQRMSMTPHITEFKPNSNVKKPKIKKASKLKVALTNVVKLFGGKKKTPSNAHTR